MVKRVRPFTIYYPLSTLFPRLRWTPPSPTTASPPAPRRGAGVPVAADALDQHRADAGRQRDDPLRPRRRAARAPAGAPPSPRHDLHLRRAVRYRADAGDGDPA